jgi:excisionase family DNA binding protein
MPRLASDGDQLEMFDQDSSRPGQSRGQRAGAKPQLTEREIAELAEIVARRVVAALPSEESSDGRDRHPGSEPIAGALMTASEIAGRLGVKPGWIYRQSRAGRIPTVKLGRYYRYGSRRSRRGSPSENVRPDLGRADVLRA